MAAERRRDGSGCLGLGEPGPSGNNDGSSEGEGLGAPECRNAGDVRAPCQRQLPHPVRQVRIQGVNGGRRQLRATALPSRLERIPGGRAGRSAANLCSTQRVAGNQRTARRPISAQHHLPEEPRIPQFVLWQLAGSIASRRGAVRACQSEGCPRTEYWRSLSRTGATVNALNPSAFADLGRAPTFSDTLVEVAIAESVIAAE